MKKAQKTKLDKLVREICLARDKCCLKCGKTTALHASHIYPKGKHPKMRFNLDNVKMLCVGCHLYWWHKHPIQAKEWAVDALGRSRLNRLKKQSNTIDKTLWDFNEIQKSLKITLEEVTNENT